MKIIDLLNTRDRTLSFEVFPPKREANIESVRKATEEIASIQPDFMSVTYGAGGGFSKYTVDIAQNIIEKYGVQMLAHLTCVASSKDTIAEKIEGMRAAGIENVLALRGDLTPELAASDRSTWDYQHADKLVRQLKDIRPELCVGGACYPETHPESKSSEEDLKHLKEKVDAGCDFLTTQMFFENKLYYDFLDKAQGAGIKVPVIAGIMPITNITQVQRASGLSGSYMPPKFLDMVEKYQDDGESLKRAGIEYALEQIDDLYGQGVKHVHVYTMNKKYLAEEIWAKFGRGQK